MSKTRKRTILLSSLFIVAGVVFVLLILRPQAQVRLSGGYLIEKASYDLLRERLTSDETVLEVDARNRVLFALGYEEGLIDFRNMAEFRKSLEKENERRRAAIESGQAVFGLMQYGAFDYLDYIVSNLMLRLPERLEENGTLSVKEDDIRQFYELHKEKRYRYPARATLEMLELEPWRENLDKILDSIERDLQNGEDFKDIAARYDPERGAVEMTIKEDSKMQFGFLDLYELAVSAEPDVVNGPYSLENGIVYFKLVRYEWGGITSFEDALFFVRKDVVNQMFEEFLQQETAKLTSEGAQTK